MSVAAPREIRSAHVLMALTGFFGAMLIANGIFIYLAVSTFDGTEKDAYAKGINYNARIEAAKAQEALGWSYRVALGADGTVTLAITGQNGAPVRQLALEGELSRPAAQRISQPLAFTEAEDGTYHAVAAGLEFGNWLITVNARRSAAGDSGAAYQLKERLWLAPRQ
jgi:nitrogen fixation protein FixH